MCGATPAARSYTDVINVDFGRRSMGVKVVILRNSLWDLTNVSLLDDITETLNVIHLEVFRIAYRTAVFQFFHTDTEREN